MNKNHPTRSQWLTALSALVEDLIVDTASKLSTGWTVRPKTLSQSGLGMLKLRDSAFNQPFYLGEFPLTSAWLEVTTADGQTAEGAAQLLDDRLELVEALALCDAILAARLPGHEQLEALVAQGLQQSTAVDAERKRILAHTRVDFSLLDDAGEQHADA